MIRLLFMRHVPEIQTAKLYGQRCKGPAESAADEMQIKV